MKYYTYISDAKVDMLFQQIPHHQDKKLSTEYKLDFRVMSASRKAERLDNHNRIEKLEVVCDFIREYGNIGSIDEPDEYIQDTLEMNWLVTRKEPHYVFFSGTTEKTLFGLGGSKHHMIGVTTIEQERHEMFSGITSSAYALFDALRMIVGDEHGEPLEPLTHHWFKDNPILLLVPGSAIMRNSSLYPKQRFEFLAKRLSEIHDLHAKGSTTKESSIVLASPLYVALVE